MIFLFLFNFAWASLNSDCYDKNSAKACFELSQKLSIGSSHADRVRSTLAREKACKLGMKAACTPPSKGETDKVEKTLTATETMKLKRSEVESKIADLPAILQDARMEKRPVGYEFTQIESGSMYEKLGFKVGDTLLEINGHAFQSPSEAMTLFYLLRESENFDVKLKRAGKTLTRKYEIKD